MKLKNDETASSINESEILSGLLILVGAVLSVLVITGSTVLYAAFWEALVGWQLWQWFAVPLGAPSINGWQVAGVGILLGMLRTNLSKMPQQTEEEKKNIWLKTIFMPPLYALVYLFVGFLIAHMAGLA
jgi:hypothetical protein